MEAYCFDFCELASDFPIGVTCSYIDRKGSGTSESMVLKGSTRSYYKKALGWCDGWIKLHVENCKVAQTGEHNSSYSCVLRTSELV